MTDRPAETPPTEPIDITWPLLEAAVRRTKWTRARAAHLAARIASAIPGGTVRARHSFGQEWERVVVDDLAVAFVSGSIPLVLVARCQVGGGAASVTTHQSLGLVEVAVVALDAALLTATTHALMLAFPRARVPARIVPPVFSALDLCWFTDRDVSDERRSLAKLRATWSLAGAARRARKILRGAMAERAVIVSSVHWMPFRRVESPSMESCVLYGPSPRLS